ncbi:peptidyl-prolyl cis-trans isomerase G-like isoform X1 [Tribolium madens]|uniref:peptidyl-prolyl cis-trans isomerase G-like isoform X1 n=1 Tax=Tribolium madens TaxID=41895 RepID=UPI001CF7551A|nr:peptidyl-prolyl cis-trans isomerase G-like isoform X1 [Tribolium madens]
MPQDDEGNNEKKNEKKKCRTCSLSFPRNDFATHSTSAEHKKRKEEMENKEIVCKICEEKFLIKNSKEHKKSEKHLEAEKRKKGEDKCKTCGEKYLKCQLKKHKKTLEHKNAVSKLKPPEKFEEKSKIRETYLIRADVAFPEAHQLYFNMLTVFYALRFSLENGNKNFKISLNDEKWDKFGDIVFETASEIHALQCKKTQTRNSITTETLSAESGIFSIKEQCQVLKKLREKKEYEKVAFKLFTVSFFSSESVEFELKKSKEEVEQSENNDLPRKEKIIESENKDVSRKEENEDLPGKEKTNKSEIKDLPKKEEIEQSEDLRKEEIKLSENEDLPRKGKTKQSENKDLSQKEDIRQSENKDLSKKEEVGQSVNEDLPGKEETKKSENKDFPKKEDIGQAEDKDLGRNEEIELSESENLQRKGKTKQSENKDLPRKEEIRQSENENLSKKEEIGQSENKDLREKKETKESENKNFSKKEQIEQSEDKDHEEIKLSENENLPRKGKTKQPENKDLLRKAEIKLPESANLPKKLKTQQSGDKDLRRRQSESEEFDWKEGKLKIAQSKHKSLFNTTGDPDDTFVVKVENCDKKLKQDLDKFRIFINQKKINGLEFSIKKMIRDEFGEVCDVCDCLVKFVKIFFQTNERRKHNFKLTKNDFVIKLCELLLEPFHIIPDVKIEEKDENLWVETIKDFDIVMVKNNPDIVEKIYSIINFTVKKLIQTDLKPGQNVKIEKNKIENDNLKSEFFDLMSTESRDLTLNQIYLALWRLGLVPMVLKVENFDHLDQILKITNFLKTVVSRQFIISTDLKPQFPSNLKYFQKLSDVQNPILSPKFKIFNFEVSLKEMCDLNNDFLQKLTPDDFLNILCQDFCFKDTQMTLTSDIVDKTWVLSDENIKKIQNGDEKSPSLKYLINDEEGVRYIEVPPEF